MQAEIKTCFYYIYDFLKLIIKNSR